MKMTAGFGVYMCLRDDVIHESVALRTPPAAISPSPITNKVLKALQRFNQSIN